jgi:ABC-2 type transport system ATP-binding protein
MVVDRLTKRYRSGRGIEDVSLTVDPGSVVALLGPNGAGKTTTVRCLVGLLRPDRGAALIGGHPAGSDRAKRETAFVPDNPDLYPILSVEEHLRFRALAFGVRRDLDERVAGALRDVGLEELADQPAGELSRGQRQRVMIAAALVQHASAYILDEPTAGLDPPALAWIEEWLRRTAQRGAGVLVASHNLDFVARVADRAILILDGRVAVDLAVPTDDLALRAWRDDIITRYGEEP